MTHDDRSWPVATAQFLGQLYTCVWQNLTPFLGPETLLELVRLSTQRLQDAYPFLAAFVWTPQGLDTASVRSAIASEAQAHVQAGGERLLQELQQLVQACGGTVLAQRLHTATEHNRSAFDPALSKPAPTEEDVPSVVAVETRDGALPAMQSMGRQALALYRRLQETEAALAQAQAELARRDRPAWRSCR